MEDGEENFEISKGNGDPEEENEISKEDPDVFHADSIAKITPNSILSIGDSNGSPGIELEEEEGDSHGFHLPLPQAKKNSGMNAAVPEDLKNIHPEEGQVYEAGPASSEDGVEDDDSAQAEGLPAWPEVYKELSKPGAAEDLMSAELTTDSTHSLMCLSDIASTLRPNLLPGNDGSEPDNTVVNLNESGQEMSHGALSESGSAFDCSSPGEARTGVSSILHKEDFSEVDDSESFSESRPCKVGENDDFGIVDNVERTICKDIFRVNQDESLGHCKWNKLSSEESVCPNGEIISSDSLLDSNQHDYNLSVTSNSPVNRLSDLEKEPLNNSTSKQICDSEQTCVYDKGGNGTCNENEIENVSAEPGIEELPNETVQGENCGEIPSGVCDKAPQDETISTQVLSDNKSSAPSVRENQCNGDIDFHEDSNQDNVEWCDDVNVLGESEGRPEVEDSTEGLEGKRKQTFDDAESNSLPGDAESNSLPGNAESSSSAKMFKVDHNVAQISQERTVDRSSVRPPCVSQPLDGRALFPGNIQANSQISDYAQYLGLQPTVKFKCVRCGERSFSSMMDLKTHQYACLKSHTPSQPNPSPSPFPPQTSSTNFRITRKVYLCSVCGTYYENWNLFLHMREVHKRHICLFCLGMFSRAERLSAHLVAKHNIIEGHYGNVEEFRLSCKGSVFLMCCSCEKVFSEEDSFSNHPCRNLAVKPSTTNCLVSAKNQTSSSSTKPASTPFLEKKQTSKQSAEAVGRPGKSSETKAGKASAASARPKQILKVKIPIQPKKQDAPPARTPKAKASLPPPPQQPPEKNGFEIIQPLLTEAHLDAISESVYKSDQTSGISSQPTDPNFMSNLDRTINSVALGISSEGLEWQQRKNDEFEESLEEPASLPCLDGASKSDSDSNEPSILNVEGNANEVPLTEFPAEPAPEFEAEQPQLPPPPLDIPEMEPTRSEPESTEQLPAVEDVPMEQPEPETESELSVPSPLLAEEPVLEKPPSPTEPEPAQPEQTAEESDIDSDDSDKLSLVVDEAASGAENEEKNKPEEMSTPQESVPTEEPIPMEELSSEEPVENESLEKVADIPLAGEDVLITEVTIEEPLEDIPIQALLKECVKALCYVCVYCSHARRIAVNGKQLALHTLAEHRFSPIDGSDSQDPPPTVRFTLKLKDSVQTLQDMFFNTDTYDSTDKSSCLPYDRTYECFHCHFFTRSHKELYIHNRKMHQKTILLCIMCKSNFYSYSELLCHLCPGIYIPQCNVGFHCCMCDVDNLPSAFRLMVHLRKRHHACDVCLEVTGDQQKLSSHVWKHKLHHLCYRCGIAYRNKPDITNHLFWKHGTESVLCKKCLQKKWPHVYHFCVPPATFTCEECNSLFTRAVSLRVHKRLHTGEQPHSCTECEEKFISKKLLAKHTLIHRTPVPEEKPDEPMDVETDDKDPSKETSENAEAKEASDVEKERESDKKSKKKKHKEKEEQKKKVVDVYDLPPLNLSSESDSSDDEAKKETPAAPAEPAAPAQLTPTVSEPVPPIPEPVDEPQPAQVLGIWDNFTNFQKNLEKRENPDAATKVPTPEPQEDPNEALFKIVMMDHDYCAPIDPNKPPPEPAPVAEPEVKEEEKSEPSAPEEPEKLDPVNVVEENPSVTPTYSKDDAKSIPSSESPTKKKRSPKKKTRRKSSSSSSGSSSGSDSSSCSCGTNCSCSSSSSSDSSSSSSDSDSSSSEGRRRAQVRRELRKERALEKKKEEDAAAAAAPQTEEPHIDVMEAEPAFRESDLDTTETDTDEDFYDERPQKPPDESQVEKRNLMLLASVAPLNNGSTSPTPLQLDVQASLQQQYTVPELNPAAVTGGKKRTKKRKKKQAHYHSKLSLPPAHDVTPPVPNVADSLQAASDRFTPMYYAQSAPSPIPPLVQRHPLTASFQQSTEPNSKKPLVTKLTREVLPNPGSGSETEGRTKRKRMPNKFYGYSSDEEAEDHSTTQKWRKTEVTIAHTPPPPPPVVPPVQRTPVSPLTLKRTVPSAPPPITLQLSKSMLTAKTDSDSEESKRVTSSSSSTDSDDDAMQISEPPPHANTTLSGDAPVRESNDNLYCYCQCPYDEVSEMIACDGKNCAIEWFHFECVGIMVPPKGQWYCPDCRKHMTGYQGIE